jgi:hypothetical protein
MPEYLLDYRTVFFFLAATTFVRTRLGLSAVWRSSLHHEGKAVVPIREVKDCFLKGLEIDNGGLYHTYILQYAACFVTHVYAQSSPES